MGLVGGVWRPGQVILEQYEVRDEPRYGGLGMVHRVHHRGWELDLAVKSPRPDMLTSIQLDNFAAEAELWVGLGLHPHVVSCVYVRQIDELPRVFAEWVPGGSLAEAVTNQRLYEGGPGAATARILDLAIQTAWGIGHVHNSRLVHQDVKPANVMLAGDLAKVTDFGLSRAGQPGKRQATVRATGSTLLASFGGHTPPYRSPEQAAAAAGRAATLSRATDVWSWALTVLEMFHGAPPCEDGATAAERLQEILAEPAHGPPLPDGLPALLRACFAHAPGARPTISEAARELIATYRRATGATYPRQPPDPVRLLADGLSNQALSLLDLGLVGEAEQRWWDALGLDQHHTAAGYNAELHLWRAGRRSDEDVISEVRAVRDASPDDWTPHYLLGLVHRERGDLVRARRCWRRALALQPDAAEPAVALAECDGDEPAPVCLEGLSARPTATAVSGDGALALGADDTGTLYAWDARTGHRRRRLTRHDPTITVAAVNDTGDLAVLGHGDGRLSWWWPNRRQRPRRFAHRPGSPVTAVAISGDGGLVAAGHADGEIDLYETGGGTRVVTLPCRSGPVDLLALDHTGTRMMSGTHPNPRAPGSLQVWELAGSGSPRPREFPDLMESDRVAVSPDAAAAVVARLHGPLVHWDAASGAVSSADSPARGVSDVSAFTARAGLLLTTGGGSHLRFWEPDTGRCLRSISDEDYGAPLVRVEAARYSRDGRVVVLTETGYTRSHLRVLPVPTRGYQAPWQYVQPRGAATLADTAARFDRIAHQSGQLLDAGAVADALAAMRAARKLPGFSRHPRLLRHWRRAGEQAHRSGVLGAWPLLAADGARAFTQPVSAAISARGDIAIVGTWTGELQVWDLGRGKLRQRLPRHTAMPKAIVIAPDGELAVSWSNDRTVRVWDLSAGSCRHALAAGPEPVTAFAVAADGRRVITGGEAGTLWLWEPRRGQNRHTIPGNGSPARAVALDRTGALAAVVSDIKVDTLLQFFDLATGAHVATSRIGYPWARVEFAASSGLALTSDPFGVKAWDVRSGEFRYQVPGAGGTAPAFGWGVDGRVGVVARSGGGIRVWALPSGRVLRVIPEGGAVAAVAVTADSRFAITGGEDRLVRVWDLRTGECVRRLAGHRAPISLVRLSADGTRLITADLDGGLRAWEVDWDFEVTEMVDEFVGAPGEPG